MKKERFDKYTQGKLDAITELHGEECLNKKGKEKFISILLLKEKGWYDKQ